MCVCGGGWGGAMLSILLHVAPGERLCLLSGIFTQASADCWSLGRLTVIVWSRQWKEGWKEGWKEERQAGRQAASVGQRRPLLKCTHTRIDFVRANRINRKRYKRW